MFLFKSIDKEYLKNSSIIFIFTMFTNVSNYVYQIFCNRNLSSDDFGLLNSIISFMSIILVGLPILKQWSNKVFSEIYSKGYEQILLETLTKILKYIIIFVIVVCVLLFFFKGYLYNSLKFNNSTIILYMFFSISLTSLQISFSSLLESNNKFFQKYFSQFLYDVFMLLLLFTFIKVNFNIENALLIRVISATLLLSSVFLFSKKLLKNINKVENFKDNILESKRMIQFLKVGVGAVCLTLILNIDIFLGRTVLSAKESGVYATVSIFGRAIIFFATVNLPLFFIKSSEAYYKGVKRGETLLRGVGYTTALLFTGYVGLRIIIRPFVSLLNPEYFSSIDLIITYSESMFPYVYIYLFITHFIAYGDHKPLVTTLIAVIAQGFLLFFYSKTVIGFIEVRLFTGIAICLFLTIYIFYSVYDSHKKGTFKF